jgi:hypothetical protein
MSAARPALAWLASVVLAACGGAQPLVPHSPDAGLLPDADAGTALDGGESSCDLPLSGDGLPLLAGLAGPRRLATDGTFLYVGVTGPLTQAQGRVLRLPLAGGAVQEVAQGLQAPDALAAEPGALYVADAQGLWRVDTATFVRQPLHDALNNAALGATELRLLGDALLYTTGFRRLVRVEKDGSGATVLHEAPAGAAVRGLAVHEGTVRFLVTGGPAPGLWRVPADGAAPAERLRPSPVEGLSLTADGDRLLWTQGPDGAGEVVSAALDGSAPAVLFTELQRPARAVRLGEAVYVKDRTSGSSERFFLGRTPCGQVVPVGPSGVGPGDLLLHQGVLYFSSEDVGGQGYVGRLP